jgi:hypothetical protein
MGDPMRKRRGLYLLDVLVNGFLAHAGMRRIVPPPGYIALDPHVHSLFSGCSLSSIERILVRAAEVGLGAIAIMDHNDLQSAGVAAACAQDLKSRKLIPDDFLVIPGMEIGSGDGHIGALFVDKPIPRKLGMPETVQRIHEAGGLAVAVHPYLKSGIGDALFDAPFDAVEIESGSVFGRTAAERGHKLLDDERLKNVAKLGSSDAHYYSAVGICYTLVKANEITPESIRAALIQGATTAHASDASLRLRKLLGWLPMAGQASL